MIGSLNMTRIVTMPFLTTWYARITHAVQPIWAMIEYESMDSPRFELGTSCLQGRRSTGLSYKPMNKLRDMLLVFLCISTKKKRR